MAKNEVRSVVRMNGVAKQLSVDGLGATLVQLLDTIQSDMFKNAKALRDSRLVRLETWDGFVKTLDAKNMILAPWCERVECEKDVKERSSNQLSLSFHTSTFFSLFFFVCSPPMNLTFFVLYYSPFVFFCCRSFRALGDTPADEKAPSMGAKTLCIPFNQPTENPIKPGETKCFACNHHAKSYTLWGRSY